MKTLQLTSMEKLLITLVRKTEERGLSLSVLLKFKEGEFLSVGVIDSEASLEVQSLQGRDSDQTVIEPGTASVECALRRDQGPPSKLNHEGS